MQSLSARFSQHYWSHEPFGRLKRNSADGRHRGDLGQRKHAGAQAVSNIVGVIGDVAGKRRDLASPHEPGGVPAVKGVSSDPRRSAGWLPRKSAARARMQLVPPCEKPGVNKYAQAARR